MALFALAALAARLAVLAAPLFSVGLAPIADATTPAKWRSEKTCATCHPAQAAEWSHSRHAVAWTNAIFQREYRQQPLTWCVHCHAPLASQFAEVQRGGGPLADEGVTCAVCHVRGGQILARQKHPTSPHQTQVLADFGSASFCAGCHQFNFPLFGADGQVKGYSAFPMQNTVAQFARGPHRDKRCGDCHARSPSGHTFPGAHDANMLRTALKYSLCRQGGAVRVTLHNAGAGHNVPTGDVHRHILVRLWRSSSPERLYEYSLTRRYEPVAGGGKRTVLDTTLPAGATRTLSVPLVQLGPAAAADEPLSFELRYVYTIDEFPFRGHELQEPTYESFASARLLPDQLPLCAPP
jgi:hypothetical protein